MSTLIWQPTVDNILYIQFQIKLSWFRIFEFELELFLKVNRYIYIYFFYLENYVGFISWNIDIFILKCAVTLALTRIPHILLCDRRNLYKESKHSCWNMFLNLGRYHLLLYLLIRSHPFFSLLNTLLFQ